jgi:RimJ/RimL family protein N-acetyltransferase
MKLPDEPREPIPLAGRYTRLRPISPRFVDSLYELAVTERIPWQWQAVLRPDAFRESLWQGALAQFAIEERRTGRSVGYLRADNANLFDGYAYVSMILVPEFRMRAWPLEGAVLFGNYLFTKFELQRLYAESEASQLAQYRSAIGPMFEVEGCLKERVLVNGRREDVYILTYTRDRWLAQGSAALERALRR